MDDELDEVEVADDILVIWPRIEVKSDSSDEMSDVAMLMVVTVLVHLPDVIRSPLPASSMVDKLVLPLPMTTLK